MEIPIEKERLFRILNSLNRNDFLDPLEWNYADVYCDNGAVQVLADLGFVELKCGEKILNHVNGNRKLESHEFVEVHLKNEFLTQVGLALFREESDYD